MAGKFEIKKSANGKFHFNLKAGNGQIILSSEMYETKEGVERGIEAVKRLASDPSHFERRESIKGEPYFILKAANGLELGRSELYSSSSTMENGISMVKDTVKDAKILGLAS